jgi:hypothetical protein
MLTLSSALIMSIWRHIWPTAPKRRHIIIDAAWIPQECPACKQVATSHGWLFTGAPPRAPRGDRRKAIGAVFMHANSKDCVVQQFQRPAQTVQHRQPGGNDAESYSRQK